MNFYVVVEGIAEKKVYTAWIPYINPSLTSASLIADVKKDNFYIVNGGGNPFYYSVLSNGINDVNTNKQFDRLVVCIDSEEMSKKEKIEEVERIIKGVACRVEIRIVVQHFCFETWGLGNKKLIKQNPTSSRLLDYKRIHDVRKNDPELLPENKKEELTRVKFAEKYLKAALHERFNRLTYLKSNPSVLTHRKYFDELVSRVNTTTHINSFADLLNAFV